MWVYTDGCGSVGARGCREIARVKHESTLTFRTEYVWAGRGKEGRGRGEGGMT